MPVKNPQAYDEKKPTNVRIEPDVKERMKQEIKASKGRLTLSDIVNDALRARYSGE